MLRKTARSLLWPNSTAEVARGSFHYGHLIYFVLFNSLNDKWGYYYFLKKIICLTALGLKIPAWGNL